MVTASLPVELADLAERVARHRRGLAFLHQGYLDNVAITLGVHPFVVDAVREWLETADGRSALIEEVNRRAAATRAAEARAAEARGAEPEPPDGEAEAMEVLRRAEAVDGGLALLEGGRVEEAARVLSTHPYLVFRARGIIQRRNRS